MANGPIDYSVNIQDPFRQAISGLQLGQALQAIPAQRAAQQQAMAAAKAEAERQRRLQGERERFAALPSPGLNDYQRLLAFESPEKLKSVEAYYETQGKEKIQETLKTHGEIVSALEAKNPQVAIDILARKALAAENSGDKNTAKFFNDAIKAVETDPEFAKKSAIISMISTPGGVAMAEKILKVTGGQGVDQVNVQSAQKYQNGTTLLVMKDGTTRVIDPSGIDVPTDRRQEIINEAIESGINISARTAGATESSKLRMQEILAPIIGAKTTAAVGGVKLGEKAFTQLAKVEANVGNLNRAIKLVKGGANTGALQAKLPSWNSSTVELLNLQRELGLDVVGAATFGGLSEGELNLALSVALPTNLSPPELQGWLEAKVEAQKKLATGLRSQVKFLQKGHSIADWIETQEARAEESAPAQTAPAGTPSRSVQEARAKYGQYAGGR